MSLTSSCWNRLRWPTQLPSAPASGRAHYATRYRAVAPQIAGFALGGSAGVAFEPRTTGLRLLCNPLSGHLLLGPREVPPVGVARSPPSPVRGQVVLLGLRPSRPALAPQIAGFVCIRFSFSVRILLFWPRGVRGGVNLLRTLKKPRFRFGFLSRLRPYWCFRAFLLRAFSFFFCHDVYLTCADATPKVRILGHRGRARGGLGVAKAKDRSSLPVSLKKRKKETAWPHRRSIAHKAQ